MNFLGQSGGLLLDFVQLRRRAGFGNGLLQTEVSDTPVAMKLNPLLQLVESGGKLVLLPWRLKPELELFRVRPGQQISSFLQLLTQGAYLIKLLLGARSRFLLI